MDSLTRYLRGFNLKFKHATDEEIKQFDTNFEVIRDYINRYLAKEYSLNEEQKQKLIDLFYKVLFVKGSFDERYDNVLIHDMLKRVGVLIDKL